MGGVDTGLAHPPDFQRDQRAKEFLRLLDVRRDVVVHEKVKRLLHPPDFINDLFGRSARLSAAEVRLNRAELAFEMAAAPGLDQPYGEVSFAREDGSVGLQIFERRPVLRPVYFPQMAAPEIVDDLMPQ